MFDKLLALEWIQKYIEDFGGDSKQITVMGHGSAAMELGLLATSDLARRKVLVISLSCIRAKTICSKDLCIYFHRTFPQSYSNGWITIKFNCF